MPVSTAAQRRRADQAAGTSALLFAGAFILAALLARPILHERLSARSWSGLAVAVTGVTVVSNTQGVSGAGLGSAPFVLAAVTLYGLRSTTTKAFAQAQPGCRSWCDGGLDAAWVHVTGELDIATAPKLVRTLGQAQSRARLVVLDLRGLAFMDSSGMHAIAGASARAREVARRLIVLRGPANVDRVFTLSGSEGGVELYDLDPVEPPVQVLLRLAAEGLA